MVEPMFSAPISRRGAQGAFTLVELLVVISIIAVLAGLGFTGGQAAMRQAKKTQTLNLLNTIKIGVNQYMTEYGKLPNLEGEAPEEDAAYASDSDEFKTLVEILLGAKGDDASDTAKKANPRQIVFVEFQNKDFEGNAKDNKIMAPIMSGKRKPIYIVLDYDYDGKLTKDVFEMGDEAKPKDDVRGSVALWNQGAAADKGSMLKGDLIATW